MKYSVFIHSIGHQSHPMCLINDQGMKGNNAFLTTFFLPFTKSSFSFLFIIILFILKEYRINFSLSKIDKE